MLLNYSGWRILFTFALNVVVLRVILLNVVMPNVVMLSVVAPVSLLMTLKAEFYNNQIS